MAALEPYGSIPILASGVRVVHTVQNYPDKIIFWMKLGQIYLCGHIDTSAMITFQRLRYALYLHIVVTAILGLILSIASADVIAFIPRMNVGELISSPYYFVPAYAICFLVAPWISLRYPIKRN